MVAFLNCVLVSTRIPFQLTKIGAYVDLFSSLQGTNIRSGMNPRNRYKSNGSAIRRVLLTSALTLFFILGSLAATSAAEEKVVQIRLKNRHAGEILPMAQPLISPRGFISADRRTNSLIIIDNPTAIARIRRLIQELDQEVPLLKIRVRYESDDTDQANEASAAVRAKTGNTTVEIGEDRGKGTGIEADIDERRSNAQRQSEYILRVRSGGIAHIESGYDVPHRDRWRELSHRYGYIPDGVVFRRVASGYSVRAVLMDDQVRIEIIPRINYFDNRGRHQDIQFAQAATTLFAPLGKWVDIGGVLGGHRDIDRQILADSQHASDDRLTMRLMVTVD